MKGLVLIISFSFFLNGLAFAGDGADSMKEKHGIMKQIKNLDLSDEQLTKLKEIKKSRKDNKSEWKNQYKNIKVMKQKLKEAFASDKSDDEIRSLKNKMETSYLKLKNEKFEMM